MIWMQNFISKLPGYQTVLGLVLADTTAITADLNAYIFMINLSATFKTKSQDVTAFKVDIADGVGPSGPYPANPTLPVAPAVVAFGVVTRLTALVNRILAAPGYTAGIGEDLGIVAPAIDPGDPTDPKPTGTAIALPNSQVQINWFKGAFTGVIVESQRAGETTWTVLSQDFSSPYVDARPPLAAGAPEVRRYRLRYLQGDTPVGVTSDVMVVTTTP